MIKKYFLFSLICLTVSLNVFAQNYQLNAFNNVVFYDGYAATKTTATPAGIVRLDNSRYARKITPTEIASFNNTLSLEVKINALCDNYDRQGGVFFAFVPTGENITSSNKKTIEIGRYITPFMNMNVAPNEVSYQYDLNHLIGIFKDATFLQNNDIWVEFFLFGVPYAAHKEIPGCAGREDVFQGTVNFTSAVNATVDQDYLPKPLWSRKRINKTTDSDFPGTAARMVSFSTDEDLVDAHVQLITSAHGANTGGEEYVRRQHLVYFDDVEVLKYTPGGLSCENFRKYNTQPNGIYGSSVQSTAWWAAWNNWCPGDKIPNRIIKLGNVATGSHSLKISIPSGQFPNSNDEVFLSSFIYSKDNALLDNKKVEVIDYVVYPNPTTDQITINATVDVKKTTLIDLNGKVLLNGSSKTLNIQNLPASTYILNIEFANGVRITEKIVKN
ncbi:MAG: peptide-N-glycosidase F-related protein [Myroides sp.]